MKQISLLAMASATLLFAAFGTTPAFSENYADADIIYQKPKPKHDKRIEAAAIEKVAAKIGELRGSLEGDLIGKVIREDDLNNSNPNRLGFPIIEEQTLTRDMDSDAVPMV